MRTVLLASLVASGCTIGARVPLGPPPVVAEATFESGPVGVAGPQATYASGPQATYEPGPTPGAAGGFTGCAPDPAGPDFSSAGPLVPGQLRGCVERKQDVFVITAPENAYGGALYKLRLTADDQICAHIYDEDRQDHGASCSDDQVPRAFWAAIAPGTRLYVRLERTHSRSSPYILDVHETVLDDPDEPNNGLKGAVPLKLGEKHAALMQRVLNDSKLGLDVYAVDVPKSGQLGFVVDPGSGDATPEVDILDEDRRKVGYGSGANEGAVARGSAQVRAGRYFVVVRENYSTHRPAGGSTTVDEHPSGHYYKPYTIRVDMSDRVSRR